MFAGALQEGDCSFAVGNPSHAIRDGCVPQGGFRQMNVEFVVFRQQYFKPAGWRWFCHYLLGITPGTALFQVIFWLREPGHALPRKSLTFVRQSHTMP
jgi:hypothetical protein